MIIFKSMIFFGVIILIVGLLMSYIVFGLTESCDSVKVDGFDEANQCPPREIPWNLFGIYLLPGIILIGSGIILKKKSR